MTLDQRAKIIKAISKGNLQDAAGIKKEIVGSRVILETFEDWLSFTGCQEKPETEIVMPDSPFNSFIKALVNDLE